MKTAEMTWKKRLREKNNSCIEDDINNENDENVKFYNKGIPSNETTSVICNVSLNF